MHLPVLVDGAKIPDQIPDSLAYEHYFTALAVPSTPSAQDKGRQDAQLNALQLTLADRQALISGIASFRAESARLASVALDANTVDQVLALRTQKAALVATTLSNLRQVLTTNGAARLDQYIKKQLKAHIVIFGGAM